MFSYKNKKLQILNLKDESKNDSKNIYNLKKLYPSDNSEIKTKKIFEKKSTKDKLYINEIEKKYLKKNNTNTNNNKSLSIKNNSNNNKNINKNTQNFSKIKCSNNSSDYLNKSILTTSNSEIKYGNKFNSNSQNYSKNKLLITQINSKLNNKDKDMENILRKNTEESSESSNKYNNISKFDEQNLNFKQKEKLKQLKYLIFNYDRKQKTIGQNNNNLMINFNKRNKINFCREKKLNKYIPTINYNKNNLILKKKFILNNYNSAEDDKISNYFQIKDIKSKLSNDYTNQYNNYIISTETPRAINEKEIRLNLISKYNLNNIFLTNDDNNALAQKNNNLYKSYNSSTCNHYHYKNKKKDYFQIYSKRCKSSFRPNKYTIFNVSKVIKEDYNKALFPLTIRLITESNIIDREISNERKIGKYLDCFGEQDMKNIKIVKKPIDFKKIRKDLNLYNMNSYLNETNIVMKGAKKVEKLLTTKREINLARSIAQKIINEDILVNNYFDFDETLSIKLRRLFERKLFKKFAGDTVLSKNNMKIKKKEKTDGEIFYKILKGDIENFFDIKTLKNLIYKYKTIKRGKKKL